MKNRLFWLLLFPLQLLWAEEPLAVHMKIDAESFYLGEPFAVTVMVKNGQPDQPMLPDLSAFDVKTERERVVGSGAARTHSFRYQFIPRRSGRQTIGPFLVMADSGEQTTKPVVLNVQTPEPSDLFLLDRWVQPAKPIYVGQPVELLVRFKVGFPLSDLRALRLELPALTDRRFQVFAEEVDDKVEHSIGVPVNGMRHIAEAGEMEIDGNAYHWITVRHRLVPVTSGEIELPPARMYASRQLGLRPTKNRYPSYFDNDFFHKVGVNKHYKRFYAEAKPLIIKVLPLPELREGVFSGVVGQPELKVSLARQTAAVGEPITVHLNLSGLDCPDAVTLPRLQELAPIWLSDFWIAPEQADGVAQENDKKFSQTLRPLRTDVLELPALKLVYFDPVIGAYQTNISEMVPLQVAPDSLGHCIFDPGGLDPVVPEEVGDGIWHNLSRPEPGISGSLAQHYWWVWLLCPLLILPWLLWRAWLMQLSEAKRAVRRRATAERQFERALRRMGTGPVPPVELEPLLRNYAAIRCDLQASSITAADVLNRTHGLSDAARKSVERIFCCSDAERFARSECPCAGVVPVELLRHVYELDRRLPQ